MKFKFVTLMLLLCGFVALNAGTLIYKTGKNAEEHFLPKVKIISIEKKALTFKHDGGIKSIPWSQVVSYYDTNIKSANFEDNTSDYTVSIYKVDMPKTGYVYKKSKKSKRKTKKVSECVIEYNISKKTKKGQSKNIRMPYFYLYVLTSRDKNYGKRPVHMFHYPDEAKVTSSNYDKAKLIEAVNSVKRPIRYHGNKTHLGKSSSKKLGSSSGNPPIVLPLKSVKGHTIIAYHLEVWGKKGIIKVKNWNDTRYKVGKEWWKKYN